jgi:hypothetical protein
MTIRELTKALCEGVDMGRADIWDTDELVSLREPTDNHGALADRQSARAEVWQAVIDYREERMDFNELLMSLQAFDKNVTPMDLLKLLSGVYNV